MLIFMFLIDSNSKDRCYKTRKKLRNLDYPELWIRLLTVYREPKVASSKPNKSVDKTFKSEPAA